MYLAKVERTDKSDSEPDPRDTYVINSNGSMLNVSNVDYIVTGLKGSFCVYNSVQVCNSSNPN
jgi:preprotein translocase subunit Sec63